MPEFIATPMGNGLDSVPQVSADHLSTLATKTPLNGNDIILVWDSENSLIKVKGTIQDIINQASAGGSGTDLTAIHVDSSNEISGIDEKIVLDGADILVIEDSANGFIKKRIPISSLPSGGEVNTNTNAGNGEGLVLPKVGIDTPMKTITAGANITFIVSPDDIEIVGGVGVVIEDNSNNAINAFSSSKILTELATKEDVFVKLTGFNLALGTIAGTVAEGDHIHTPDPQVALNTANIATKEDAFAKSTGFNLALGTIAGTVAEGDHTHLADPQVALNTAEILTKENAIIKLTGFNLDIGTTTGTIAAGDHTHLADPQVALNTTDIATNASNIVIVDDASSNATNTLSSGEVDSRIAASGGGGGGGGELLGNVITASGTWNAITTLPSQKVMTVIIKPNNATCNFGVEVDGVEELLIPYSSSNNQTTTVIAPSSTVDVITSDVPYDMNSITYNTQSNITVGGTPYGMAFNLDGTKVFVIDDASNAIREYSTSAVYDISSLTLLNTLAIGAQDALPRGLTFSNSGLKMYFFGETTDRTFEFDLSTAYDLSTATYNQFDNGVVVGGTIGLSMSPDGTRLFTVRTSSIYSYQLTTPYDISSLSTSGFGSFGSTSGTSDVFVSNNGLFLFLSNSTANDIFKYKMTTPWDISTITNTGEFFDINTQEASVLGVEFDPTGNKMFIVGASTDSIHSYDLTPTPFSGEVLVSIGYPA